MSTLLLIEQLRLQCSSTSLLISAAELDVKEYAASWRAGGEKILRQGGRFAKRDAADSNPLSDIKSVEIEKVIDSQSVLDGIARAMKNAIADIGTAPGLIQQFSPEQLERINKGDFSDVPVEQQTAMAADAFNREFTIYYEQRVAPFLRKSGAEADQALEDLTTQTLSDVGVIEKPFSDYLEESYKQESPSFAKNIANAAITMAGGMVLAGAAAAVFPALGVLFASVGGTTLVTGVAAGALWEPFMTVFANASLRFSEVSGKDKGRQGQMIEVAVGLAAGFVAGGFLESAAHSAYKAARQAPKVAKLADLAESSLIRKAAPGVELPSDKNPWTKAYKKVEGRIKTGNADLLKKLGLSKNPKDLNELRRAYVELAKRKDPSLGGNAEKLVALNNAFEAMEREIAKYKKLKPSSTKTTT